MTIGDSRLLSVLKIWKYVAITAVLYKTIWLFDMSGKCLHIGFAVGLAQQIANLPSSSQFSAV